MDKVLTQEEVNVLLQGITDGGVDTVPEEPLPEEAIAQYDLTNQDRIIRGRLPTLEVIHQRFARNLRATFFSFLHREVDVSVVSTEMKKFGEFLKTVPIPASYNLFRIKPLRGMALLVLEAPLIFAFIESLFGGGGRRSIKVEGREFTDIESRVIKRLVLIALEDLKRSWSPFREIEVEYHRSEINPEFVSVASATDVSIIVNFKLEMDDGSGGSMMICIPYSMVEPIRVELEANFQADRLEADQVWFGRLVRGVREVPVEVTSRLGTADLSVRQILEWKTGDIVQLEEDVEAPVTVFVEGVEKLEGHLGACKGNKAIQVAGRIINKEKENESLEEDLNE